MTLTIYRKCYEIAFGDDALSKPLVIGAFKGKYQENFLELNSIMC